MLSTYTLVLVATQSEMKYFTLAQVAEVDYHILTTFYNSVAILTLLYRFFDVWSIQNRVLISNNKK